MWWITFAPRYSSVWLPANTTYPIRWDAFSPASSFDPQNQWVYRFIPHLGASGFLGVFTERSVGVHTFRLVFRVQVTGGGQGRAATYMLEFPNGFPRWANAYTLLLTLDGGGWGPGGAPATWSIFNGFYTQIAPGRCIVAPGP